MKNALRVIFKTMLVALTGFYVLYFTLLSLSSTDSTIDKKLNIATLVSSTPVSGVQEGASENNNGGLQDNLEIYKLDEATSVVYMYLTVRKGNPSDNTDFTWGEVNDFTKWLNGRPPGAVVPQAEAILQIGDESGPLPGEVGYGETVSNATIRVRGNSTSAVPQKSYKLELRSGAGDWRGQLTLNLNKHISDPTRARNKLAFDLLTQIPNMTSLRTQYVRLFVRDETTDPPKITFVDYGLYTQVEQPNKQFLRNHLLDSDGQLYKAISFEFLRHADQIRLATDPKYDEAAFSSILEIKGNKDHAKLIQMLDDVNNENIPIEQTFEKYFNADNYFTWLAFNILVGNVNTQNQNFYLYSPKNLDTWYFLPWDFDASLSRLSNLEFGGRIYNYHERGLSNYWDVLLHRRVLKVAGYRALLDEKIKELKDILTPQKITGMLDEDKKVTDLYSLKMPDFLHLGATPEQYDREYELIPLEIQNNYYLYLASLKAPMPFRLGTPKISENSLVFIWDQAYDFNEEKISYHFQVSKDWEFTRFVHDETLTDLTTINIDRLSPGVYFWRVLATNEDGSIQYPSNEYRDADRTIRFGMKYLFITNEGLVLEE